MSTASANPASKGLIALRARGLTKRLDEQACIRTGFAEKTFYLLKDALETLDAEAPPAAERTTLKALRAYCVYQRENFEKGIREKPTHPRAHDWSAYAVAYTDVINEIDAQERAGATAASEQGGA